MRRTLALLGAAALAITGLAGPANANEITEVTDTVFDNVEFDTSGSEQWVELASPMLEQLDGVTFIGCVADRVNPTTFIVFGENDSVDSGGHISAHPDAISVTPDSVWNTGAVLDSNSYDLRLVLNGVAFEQDLNGTPNAMCRDALPPVQ